MTDPLYIKTKALAENLARPELLTLQPYLSARRIGGCGDVWINANESPFNNSDVAELNRYPDCQPPALIAAYSAYVNIEPTQLICGRGADEGIELLIRTFCTPAKDAIAIFTPTYGMYAISAQTFNIAVTALELTTDFQIPADISAVKNAKLIFICNPNNPTGTCIELTEIERVLNACPQQLVVVDEAYIEFNPELTACKLLKRYPNLVILRTLSKAFALAGARCGFVLANQPIIDLMMRVIAPYPVPLPVANLAQNALSNAGIKQMQADVNQLVIQGQRLCDALAECATHTLPCYGNFVLAYFDDIDLIKTTLAENGIVSRSYNSPQLVNAIRFSFSNGSDTSKLIKVLKTINTKYS